MKNLRIHHRDWKSIPSLARVQRFVQNPDDQNEIYVCSDFIISKFDKVTEILTSIFNIQDEIPIATEDSLLDLLFLSIQRKLCLVFKTGEVLLVDVDSSKECKVLSQEIFSEGINAAGLSPDQELIVIVTNDFKTYLLYTSLETVNESRLFDEYFGEREFITVGWGKKETQFHGSEGKEAAKSKLNFENNIVVNNNLTIVTWRGDGLLYAVGFTVNSQTLLKIYNREGVLQFTSEKQPGVECNFVWRPSGNVIATTQALPNKYVIAFFEKNGLKHGEFTLPFKYEEVDIVKLMWSGDSEIFSISYIDKMTRKMNIMLYTSSNYHWYLKQFITFDTNHQIPIMHWEDTVSSFAGKCLNCFLGDGRYVQYDWVWCVDHSNGKLKYDNANVGVIDGSKLLLTSFRHSIVPPPLSSAVIDCKKNINRVIFGPIVENYKINSNCFCVLLEDNSIVIYNEKFESIGTLLVDIEIDDVILNLLWLSSSSILCLISSKSETVMLMLSLSYKSDVSLIKSEKIKISHVVINMKTTHIENEVILQTSTGKLLLLSSENGIHDYGVSFPECCYQFDTVFIDESIVFGLTHRNKFYVNNVQVANNINSYFIHSHFLMLTTLQHQLLCCPLSMKEIKGLQNISNFSVNMDSKQDTIFSNRSIERGSSLVTVVSCDTRTILQMPRGNLETIQPRSLSLKIIQDYLNDYDYYSAFDLMRKQRINLNLICDHNFGDFLSHVDDFITKITNTSWLTLFISELDEQDVTTTMYSSAYRNIKKEKVVNKIHIVCESMRDSLLKSNTENKYILPIITTYVKKNTIKDLESALGIIKEIRDTNVKSLVSAIDALKYLLYMVNVDDLYNIALGMYDFDLVMFIASKSQKDPKEYVPYLNGLKKMEENYKKFTINNDLKRYELALKFLIDSSTKEGELLSFVKQHKLYKIALNQLPEDDDRYKEICEEFGNYLHLRKHYAEAGIMYMRSNNSTSAMECFMESLEWQSAMFIAARELSEEKFEEFKRKLLNKLTESGSYMEALELLQDDPNIEKRVLCALEGKLYKHALNICQQYKKLDLLVKIVKPSILEQFNQFLNLVDQNKKQYEHYKNRLLIVRETKTNAVYLEENEHLVADCDLYSDTSSILGSTSSRTSGRTYRSGKNRRKQERKLVSLKEGSRFEDIALIRALHVLITGTFKLRKDISELNFVLCWIGNNMEACQLQKSLEDTLNMMKKGFNDIWTPELAIDAFKAMQIGKDSLDEPDPSITLEPCLRIAPVIQEYKWKMEYS